MKKRITALSFVLCALFCVSFGIIAFAGDYDTPVVPIHTKHVYNSSVTASPTCAEEGVLTYTCKYCTKSYTEPIAPLGHLFSYAGEQSSEGVELICLYCNEIETMPAESLEQLWDAKYINKRPVRTADNNSGYLDLDGNRIINAKDYAAIINMRHNELKTASAQNGSLLANKTEEEL